MNGEPDNVRGEVRDRLKTGPGWADTVPGPQLPADTPPPAYGQPRRGLLLAGELGAGAIVLYLLVAAVVQAFPFSPPPDPAPRPAVAGSSPAPRNPAASAAAVTSPAAVPSTVSAPGQLAGGVKPLKDVMPYDLQDLTTECTDQAKIPWTNPGLVTALECDAPDVAGGQIFGYQLDSYADYQKAWANYNTWAEFGTSSTLDCPPGSGSSQGGPGEWWGPRYAKHAGQVLECFTSDSGPVYIWTYPTQDAFIVAQPAKSWTFSKLETWWEDNAV